MRCRQDVVVQSSMAGARHNADPRSSTVTNDDLLIEHVPSCVVAYGVYVCVRFAGLQSG